MNIEDNRDTTPMKIALDRATMCRGETATALRAMIRTTVLLAMLMTLAPAVAQVPPSSDEIANYKALHLAAHTGDLATIQRLAGDPAIREARDAHRRTALHVAAFAGRPDAASALIEAGADTAALEDGLYDAVTIAAVADDEETLRALLAGGASARLTTSRYDGTALIAAAHLGHDGVVRQLIEAGAPLDHVNNLHWTALIEAVVLGDGGPRHQATVAALLAAGANPRLADRNGHTALDLAREHGYTAMITLLEAGPARK